MRLDAYARPRVALLATGLLLASGCTLSRNAIGSAPPDVVDDAFDDDLDGEDLGDETADSLPPSDAAAAIPSDDPTRALADAGTPGDVTARSDAGPTREPGPAREPEPAPPADADPEPQRTDVGVAAVPGLPNLMLHSPAFAHGGELPAAYTCSGGSPPLAWSSGPADTLSYAIVLTEIDDTSARPARAIWALWDIPASVRTLPADLDPTLAPSQVPGALQTSDIALATLRYFNAPCSAVTRRYEFTVYALGVSTLGHSEAAVRFSLVPPVTPARISGELSRHRALLASSVLAANLTYPRAEIR